MKLKTLRGQTVTYTIYVQYMLMVGLIMGTTVVGDINRMIGRCLQGFEKHRKNKTIVIRDSVKNVFAESVHNLPPKSVNFFC